MLFQFPNSFGIYRHFAPESNIQKIALKAVRGFIPGRPVDFGFCGSIIFHRLFCDKMILT